MYRSVGREPTYSNGPIQASVEFAPDNRFYSVGVVGLPIVPTRVAVSDPSSLAFTVQLTLRRDADFSFSGRMCVVVESESLCPSEVELSAVAMVQDDGNAYEDKIPRWRWLPEFRRVQHERITSADMRITKESIYARYGYRGDPWGHLQVNIVYKYLCPKSCGLSIRVPGTDLLLVNGEPLFDSMLTFEKVRENDYQALKGVQ